jgi:hypothetical protein
VSRDWVDYWNLVFNGFSVLVAGAGLVVAIISLGIARRADREAKAAQAAETRSRGYLEEALTALIRQFEGQGPGARMPELPLPGIVADEGTTERTERTAATSATLEGVLQKLRADRSA